MNKDYTKSCRLDDEGYVEFPPHWDPEEPNIMNPHLNDDYLARHGYEEHTQDWIDEHQRPEPKPAPRTRCTKYQLVTCLRNHFPSLLPTLRAAYAANSDLQFYWNTVNDLDKTNEDFKTAQNALGITDAQVAEIFAKIEGAEPAAVE